MKERRPAYWYRQSGVIAYRRRKKSSDAHTKIDVLLITSRKRKRWIIPKGIVEPGLTPQASAAKEAFEEAGILGHIVEQALGEYTRKKWGGLCRIQVFAFQVKEERAIWPEADVRRRKWFSLSKAVANVREPALKGLLQRLSRGCYPGLS